MHLSSPLKDKRNQYWRKYQRPGLNISQILLAHLREFYASKQTVLVSYLLLFLTATAILSKCHQQYSAGWRGNQLGHHRLW